jgi:cell division protein FtsB
MAQINIVLGGRSFPILKKTLITNCGIFDIKPLIYDQKDYTVESSVPVADFEAFFRYLQTRQLPELTLTNALVFSVLSAEFAATELEDVCSLFLTATQVGSRIDQIDDSQSQQLRLYEDLRLSFERGQSSQMRLFEELRDRVESLSLEIANLRSGTFKGEQLYSPLNDPYP